MTHSGSHQPDLDWSQVRETIKLLAVSVAQVEGGMKVGDDSVNVLANSFTSMVEDMNSIHRILAALEPSESRDQALKYCEATQERINTSVVAFQFYDRLKQCLEHASVGLKGLSAIIDAPNRLYNPNEWHLLQNQIRGRYTMESEKIMFDAILRGTGIDEALALAENFDKKLDEDDIELF
jgi:hypothetical protein